MTEKKKNGKNNEPKQLKRVRVNIPMETFLQTYIQKDTYEEVAEMLGVKVSTVTQRVYNYRKQGVKIVPKFNGRRGARKLDVSKANEILQAAGAIDADFEVKEEVQEGEQNPV